MVLIGEKKSKLQYKALKNPLVLFRGSDISKDWYLKMLDESSTLSKLTQHISKLEVELALLNDQLIETIETAFAKTKDITLLNLKRDVFNNRKEKIEKYRNSHGEQEISGYLTRFLSKSDELQHVVMQFESEYGNAYVQNRKTLQENLHDEGFLKSIAFNNETIYTKLAKYMQTSSDQHNKKLKKLDFFLLKLLTRGSMKTSPFSYLTKTGLASNEKLSFEKEAYCELNHSVLLKIVHQFLRTDEQALTRIPARVENFGSRNGKVYYVSQRDIDHSNKVFETSDKFVEYELDPQLITYLESQKTETISFQQFYEQVNQIAAYEGQELMLYRKLVSLKLLKQQVTISNDRDIIGSVKAFLESLQIGEQLLPKLDELHEELISFETKDAFARINHWKKINETLQLMNTSDKKIGNEILYEDVVFKESKEDVVSDKLDSAFLHQITDFILLFDVNVRVQYEIGQLYAEAYGEQMKKVTDSNLLNTIFFSKIHHFFPYYQDQKYRYKEAVAQEVRLLDNLRDEFLQEFDTMLGEADSSNESIDLSALIASYTTRIPTYIKQNIDVSFSLFMQYAGENTVVLNNVYDGHEKFISRFKDFFSTQLDKQDYTQYTNEVFNEKNYYEIDELFGFNGGIHDRKHQQTMKIDAGYQHFNNKSNNALQDIHVKYDENTKKIKFLDAENKECSFTYKSSLVPMYLPGVLSVLLHLCQSGRMNFDITGSVARFPYVPRITMGNIILSRKKWNLSMSDINEIISSDPDLHMVYKKINAYFEDNGLPKRFFFKRHRIKGSFAVEKPLFFDIEVPLLLKFFVNEINEQDAYIEEILPDVSMPLNEYLVEYSIKKE